MLPGISLGSFVAGTGDLSDLRHAQFRDLVAALVALRCSGSGRDGALDSESIANLTVSAHLDAVVRRAWRGNARSYSEVVEVRDAA